MSLQRHDAKAPPRERRRARQPHHAGSDDRDIRGSALHAYSLGVLLPIPEESRAQVYGGRGT